jgi:hypothetical protein
MTGVPHRCKGNRVERELVAYPRDRGCAADRVPLSGSCGGRFAGDVTVPLLCVDRSIDATIHGSYGWLAGRDFLIVRADRREPLVIVPLKLAAEITAAAEHGKAQQ